MQVRRERHHPAQGRCELKPTPQHVWEWLGSPEWAPKALRRGQQPPVCDRCWLCGGDVGDAPWVRDAWLTPTFTNHTLAAAPWSDAICQACAYLGSGDAWREYCAAHPEKKMHKRGFVKSLDRQNAVAV